jgi:integrase
MATIEAREHDGGKSYRVKVRLRGYPPQTATFERLTDAKKWAQSIESAIREGRHFKTSEAKRHTFNELAERYINFVLPQKPKSRQKQTGQINWWRQELGHYLLSDITPALIAEKRDKLLCSVSQRNTKYNPATVVRYMAALSHAFSIAVNEWGWLEDSPLRKVSKPKESRGRVRYLSDDERKALLEACRESPNKLLYPVVVLAISTGMRQGEIMGLKWEDVDINNGFIILHETKNGERRRVPLTGHALEQVKALHKIRRIDTNLLFPATRTKGGSQDRKPLAAIWLRKSWVNALKEANINDFRFHDLRHSTASYLAMNGASLAEIAEVLGHKTLQMVKRYAHLSEAHTSKVVAAMNERIFG